MDLRYAADIDGANVFQLSTLHEHRQRLKRSKTPRALDAGIKGTEISTGSGWWNLLRSFRARKSSLGELTREGSGELARDGSDPQR